MTALPAAAMVFALAGTPASAGTGIQAGPVCLPTTIHPGATRALPPVTVQDKGSGDEAISLYVVKQTPGQPGDLPGRPVPASWVTFTYPRKWLVFSQSSVSVASGATAAVPAHLAVPSSAQRGSYVSWIVAAPGGSIPGKANFGADAFTFLQFTVTKPGSPARHAVCVNPDAKQASPAKQASSVKPAHPAAAAKKGHLVPKKLHKYVPAIMIGAIVLGALAILRRKGWL